MHSREILEMIQVPEKTKGDSGLVPEVGRKDREVRVEMAEN